MYLCDIHTHTLISSDCKARLSDMVQSAARLGLSEFCTTDHCDLLEGDGTPITGFDWPSVKANYYASMEQLGASMTFRLGVELGSATYDPELARRILKEGGDELDFVLGSLHNWIGCYDNVEFYCMNFSNKPDLCRRVVDCCMDYTRELVTQCPDCYDSLAHIVYPFRYIRRDGQHLPITDYEEQIRWIFTEVARTGHAMEVNTCRGTDMGYWPLLLGWFKECGGELITVGSDAHDPRDVAKGIPQALELIKAAGFDYVTTYEKRRPVLHKL